MRELGWDAVTMDAVARRARLSRALVYVYFKDKRDLHFALVERALEELRTRFAAAAAAAAGGIDQWRQSAGRISPSHASCRTTSMPARASRRTRPRRASWSPTSLPAPQAGHRVHEVIVATLERGIADGSVRRDIGDPVCHFARAVVVHARGDPDRRLEGRADRA